MDFFLEVIFEFLLDYCFDIVNNEKIKPTIRKIFLLIITLLYCLLEFLFIFIALKTDDIFAKILFISSTIFILFLLVRLWIKVYKAKPFSINKKDK